MAPDPAIQAFDGHIAAMGTASGVRVVLGSWRSESFGAFADVMIERSDGHRLLLAPSDEVADFVASTYTFDEIRVQPISVLGRDDRWRLQTPDLDLEFTLGRLHPVSVPLALVPPRVRDAEWFARCCDPLARRLMPGVRTHGSAGYGRTEWYAARAVRRIIELTGDFEGADLGELRPVDPPVRFGFGSAPKSPCLTRIRTMVRELAGSA